MSDTASSAKLKKTVTAKDYEIFCTEFIFDNLKGLSFGQAFCKRFSINDNLLSISVITDDEARFLISHLGYIK